MSDTKHSPSLPSVTTPASGTLTLYLADGQVGATINGTTVTVNSTNGLDPATPTTDAETAVNLVSKINADIDLKPLFVATASTNIVTVTCRQNGTAGNDYTFVVAGTGTGITASGSGTLTGGTDLSGSETFPIITGQNGLLKKVTTQEIADLAAGGIPAAVSEALWTVDITAGSESGNAFPITAQVKDLDGNNLAGARDLYVVTLSNNTITYVDNGAGSIVKQGFTPQRAVVFQTNASGLAEFTVGNSATEDVAVVFVTPQGPVVQLLSFA